MDMLSWGSREGYVCVEGEAAAQQPAACLEWFVLNAPPIRDKGFYGAHYLTIVVQSPLYG